MLVEALTSPMGGKLLSIPPQRRGNDFGISTFAYRAYNPVLVDRVLHIYGAFLPEDPKKVEAKKVILWAEDEDGVVGMSGEVQLG